jgi:ribosome-associated toxin RatA of RatAB toxin-antitoxin module
MRLPLFSLCTLAVVRCIALFIAGMTLFAVAGIAHGAEPFAVNAERNGDAVQVEASATIRASLAVIHDTLTDYDHLADFIPGMSRSRLLKRHDKTSVIEQSGVARLWFLHFPIDVTVETVEQSPSVISVRLLKGNLKQLSGRYDIEKIDGDDNYALRWSGTIQPGINVPSVIAVPLLRRNIAEQFRGMVDEIERRAALRPDNQPG